MTALIVIVIIAGAGYGYYYSLRRHPYIKCRECKGGGRHVGSVFTYAHGKCRKCGGTGRLDRFGTRFVK